jgi:hypothetical protein
MPLLRRRRKRTPMPQMPVRYHSIVTWCKSHVSASVVELGAGSAQLMGVATTPMHGISRTSHPDIDRWFAGCDQALTQAEDMTIESCGQKIVPDHVTMCLPGEVTRALPIIVSQRRQHPEVGISNDELQRLVHRGYRKAQDVGVGSNASLRATDRAEEIVHGAVARVILDGQEIVDPLGMRGETVELHLSFFLAPLEWLRALEIVTQRLELHLVGLLPDHVVLASPLPDPRALLMVLDAEHTIVGLGSRGRLLWVVLSEMGERDIVRETVRRIEIQGRNADLLLRAYREGRLRREVEQVVIGEYWRALCAWMESTARQIRTVAGETPLPHHIYFLDATRRLPEAQPSLETPFWEGLLPFDACPETVEIDAGRIHDVMDCTTRAVGPHYVLVRALAHHVAHLYGQDNELERLLSELVREQLDHR